jgi:hypothetical protein
MAVTLLDLVNEVLDQMYSFVQVKDRHVYLDGDIDASQTTIVLDSATSAKQVQPGQLLQLGTDDTVATELVRVRSVDAQSATVTVVRGVRGTTAAAWSAASAEILVDPEFPKHNVIREINNTLASFAPDIHSYATFETVVDAMYINGYTLPAGALGVVSVQYLPTGYDDNWQRVRRWKFDPVNNSVSVFQVMEPGQGLRIRYRKSAGTMSATTNELGTHAGLEDSVKDLVVLGAVYRLLLGRASGRVVDDRAETLSNASQRTADPVMAAVRQVYALFQQRMISERERQRLANPVLTHMEF